MQPLPEEIGPDDDVLTASGRDVYHRPAEETGREPACPASRGEGKQFSRWPKRCVGGREPCADCFHTDRGGQNRGNAAAGPDLVQQLLDADPDDLGGEA